MRCYSWGAAPKIIDEYLPLLAEFGAPLDMLAWAKNFVASHSGRCLWDVQFLASNHAFDNCLNIGGAPFLFEYLLRRLMPKVEVISVDLAPDRFPYAQEVLGIRVVQTDIEAYTSEILDAIGPFDCVVLCEVFEHLRIDLIGTVTRLRDLLMKGGILYVTTPNGSRLSALYKYLLHGRTGPDPVAEWSKLREIGHMGHVREYSFTEIRDVLAHCGLTVEKCLFRRMRYGSRLPDYKMEAVTWVLPSLGDELVIVARRSR